MTNILPSQVFDNRDTAAFKDGGLARGVPANVSGLLLRSGESITLKIPQQWAIEVPVGKELLTAVRDGDEYTISPVRLTEGGMSVIIAYSRAGTAHRREYRVFTDSNLLPGPTVDGAVYIPTNIPSSASQRRFAVGDTFADSLSPDADVAWIVGSAGTGPSGGTSLFAVNLETNQRDVFRDLELDSLGEQDEVFSIEKNGTDFVLSTRNGSNYRLNVFHREADGSDGSDQQITLPTSFLPSARRGGIGELETGYRVFYHAQVGSYYMLVDARTSSATSSRNVVRRFTVGSSGFTLFTGGSTSLNGFSGSITYPLGMDYGFDPETDESWIVGVGAPGFSLGVWRSISATATSFSRVARHDLDVYTNLRGDFGIMTDLRIHADRLWGLLDNGETLTIVSAPLPYSGDVGPDPEIVLPPTPEDPGDPIPPPVDPEDPEDPDTPPPDPVNPEEPETPPEEPDPLPPTNPVTTPEPETPPFNPSMDPPAFVNKNWPINIPSSGPPPPGGGTPWIGPESWAEDTPANITLTTNSFIGCLANGTRGPYIWFWQKSSNTSVQCFAYNLRTGNRVLTASFTIDWSALLGTQLQSVDHILLRGNSLYLTLGPSPLSLSDSSSIMRVSFPQSTNFTSTSIFRNRVLASQRWQAHSSVSGIGRFGRVIYSLVSMPITQSGFAAIYAVIQTSFTQRALRRLSFSGSGFNGRWRLPLQHDLDIPLIPYTHTVGPPAPSVAAIPGTEWWLCRSDSVGRPTYYGESTNVGFTPPLRPSNIQTATGAPAQRQDTFGRYVDINGWYGNVVLQAPSEIHYFGRRLWTVQTRSANLSERYVKSWPILVPMPTNPITKVGG